MIIIKWNKIKQEKLLLEGKMLNSIWPMFLIVSFIFAALSGNISNANMAIFESTESAVNLCIKLLGTICLWNGIMKIAEKTSIVKILKNWFKPILKFLFPKINENEEVYRDISMNMVANVMGLRECGNTNGVKSNEIIAKKEQR